MSEDRLERALQEMRQEEVDDETFETARARVWGILTDPAAARCAEFRADFPAYLGGTLTGGRRVLMDDHLTRCPACRAAMADVKGDRRVVAMPQRSPSRRARWGTLAAAAALFLLVAYLGRDAIDAWLAPGGPRAAVVSVTGSLYRLPGETLQTGAAIGEKETIRTGPGAHAVLRLTDRSIVDVNERTELFVTAAWSGRAIHLQRGDVIVRAARQRRGLLRVLTRDSIASVKGTVFAVSAGLGGSVVTVVEGSVAVSHPGRKLVLGPGEQAASNPALATSVTEAVAWSPDADKYLELLGSFAKIERRLAGLSPGELRTGSTLLAFLPAGTFVYGAVPNLGEKIGQALVLAEQQASENAAFRAWWNSETGLALRRIIDRVRSVSSLLGDEIVFCASAGHDEPVPVVIARVQPHRRAELASALDGLFAEAGGSSPPFSVSDDLMVVSASPPQLAWALAHLGQGAGGPFAAAIRERYQRGVGSLIGVDAAPLIAMAAEDDTPPPIELAGLIGLKYLFLEQRAPAGAEENEVTLVFPGVRTGLASWLADAGSGGAAEYLPADALLAGYVSMREPRRLFQEFTALITKQEESFDDELAKVDEKLGAGFIANLTAAMGTEAAFALTGFSVDGPMWVMVGMVNDPAVIDSSLRKLIDTSNAELAPDTQQKRIVLGQESAGGRVWSTMKGGSLPFRVTWTYDGGYMVAASDRASAERAMAARNGGSPLVWSPAFLGQLPSSPGIHPSGFAWLNTKGALGAFSTLSPKLALAKLLAERDPVLVVFDGKPEQILAASRARLTGLIMDVMLLDSLSRTRERPQSVNVR